MSQRTTRVILITPIVLVLAIVGVAPTLYAVWLSFRHATIQTLSDPSFTGIANYVTVFRDGGFWYSLKWTLRFAVVASAIELFVGVALAVLLNRDFPGKSVAITLLLLPMMVSPALIGTMLRLQVNEFVGPIAYIITQLGGDPTVIMNAKGVQWTLVVVDVMQQSPFIFLTVYAGLQGVPEEVLEAAVVDGATYAQRFWRVTLPIVSPFLKIAGLLRFMNATLVFGLIVVLTGGGPGIVTQAMSVYIYFSAFKLSNYGIAGAAAVLFLLILLGPCLYVANVLAGEQE
jgi:multiple sugar transport system permease protein